MAKPRPHEHHALSTTVGMKDLRRHLVSDHRHGTAHLTNDFGVLNQLHQEVHGGHAPEYKEGK